MNTKLTKLTLTMLVLSSCLILESSIASTVVVVPQSCDSLIPMTTPTSRFIDNQDGTVTDTRTKLMWQKCIDGRSGSDCSGGTENFYSWSAALQQAETLNNTSGIANYTDWRLPNIKELFSITERSCIYPRINITVFPNDRGNTVWSATPNGGSEVKAVSYSDGSIYTLPQNINGTPYPAAVRLVRTIPQN